MKNIIKLSFIFIFSVIVLFSNEVFSQRSFGSRIFAGGNLGLQFGNPTLIDISPLVGYRLTEQVDVGVSITYKYYSGSYKYASATQEFNTNIFGGGVFSRYNFTDYLFAHAEIEYLNFDMEEINNGIKDNRNIGVTSVFIGGGIKQSFATIMLLYNLNETMYSPYTNPIIRIGFTFGL